jgi:D-lyxose ketol-isomerase
MKRSEINSLIREASRRFAETGWVLPPHPKWDVTDFGLGDWRTHGLVLINLAEEPEYCEKLMYAKQGMVTPTHCHRIKKEDIICRAGRLSVTVWAGSPPGLPGVMAKVKIDGERMELPSGTHITLSAGQRITLIPGVYHEFEAVSEDVVIGEVSTANDDLHDNVFVRTDIGRYPGIEEDEPPLVRLIGETAPA